MKGKSNTRNLGRRISALLLSMLMIASLISTPAKAAENENVSDLINAAVTEDTTTVEGEDVAEGKDYSNIVEGDVIATVAEKSEAVNGTTVKNAYGEDFIVDVPFAVPQDAKDAVAAGVPLKFNVSVTVNSHNLTTGTPEVVAYAMDGTNWKQVQNSMTEGDATYELSLDLSTYASLSSLGLRFATQDEGATINYTINSAKIVVGKEIVVDPNAKAVLADPGTKKDGVVVKNAYGEDYIVDNAFTVPHDLAFGLQGYTSLSLEVGVTVNEYTPDVKPENAKEGEVPFGAKVLIYAQNSKYSIWEQSHEMLGDAPQTFELKLDLTTFIEDGTLGALGLRFADCKEGTTIDYTIEYAKVVGEGESLANTDIVDLKYELTGEKKNIAFEDTAVGQHGKLSVKQVEGYTAPTIVDENGAPYQLHGGSSHGLSWFPGYINKDAYQTFRDEWGMNMIRIAVYAHEGDYAYAKGYANVEDEVAKEYNDKIIQEGVKAATELGMYAIVDWHVLNYNPNEDLEEATAFFEKYATMYQEYENVIFEICNEPTQTEWYQEGSEDDLYTYCTKVTKTIRDCGSDAIVICGTNSYSSDVDKVAEKPLEDTNVLYACHFYSASHYDDAQEKLTDALTAGVPVIISEFGVCTASGDGMYDLENADKWLDICDANNVSYACWAMSNSEESAAYFQSDCWKYDGAWTQEQLTSTSKYIINRYRSREENLVKETTCKHDNTEVRYAKEPTCKNEGWTGYTFCVDCNKNLKLGEVIATTDNHTWDDGTVTKEPDSEAAGIMTYTCKDCGEKKDVEFDTGVPNNCKHTNTEVKGQKEATCKETGYTGDIYCKDCDEKLEDGTTTEKLTEHTWDDGVITTEPTKEASGVETYTCKVCEETKTMEIPFVCEHINTELRNVKAALCTETTGYSGDTYCKDCGEKLKGGNITPMPNKHKWDEENGVVIEEPTKEADGKTEYTCIICGGTETRDIPYACKHIITEVKYAENATCALPGYTGDTYCTECGDFISKGNVINKLTEHTNTEVRGAKEASCKSAGYTGNTYCVVCGMELAKGTEIPMKEHKNTELKNVKAASCKEAGYSGDIHCKACGKLISSGNKIDTSTAAHRWDDGKITTAATATKPGVTTYKCLVCGTTKEESISATSQSGQSNGDKSNPTTGQSTNQKTEQSDDNNVNVLEKGEEINISNAEYKVLEADSEIGTVAYIASTSADTESVTVPTTVKVNGITYKVTSIEKNAFKNNKKLTKVVIGKNITSIGANAFMNCSNLKSVTIGKNVKSIGKKAFYNCKKLEKLTIKTSKLTTKNVGSKAFGKLSNKAKLVVPKKKAKDYKELLKKKK